MSFVQFVILAIFAGAALAAVMAVAWAIQRKTGNTGWVDVSWSFGVGGVGFSGALLPLVHEWPQWRQIVVAGLAATWCVRLCIHIATRTRAAGDDPRYRALIEKWGPHASRRMFRFLQAQAAVGLVLVLSIVLAAHNPDPNLRVQDILGLAVLAVAVAGEATADRQLRVFKADLANRNKVCDAGLWRWSRHPNYFFEWMSWLAYPLIAIDLADHNPYGWLALAAPFCMYWVLVHVSGIPPLEAHMLHSRGDGFRAYQRRTSAFFPWPRKQ
jgi:steroid 5-alpha reductase family enzyme